MKKKVEPKSTNESCVIMNIPKNSDIVEGSNRTLIASENSQLTHGCKSQSPPHIIVPSFKIKSEKSTSHISEDENFSEGNITPPIANLGPGAEIKGKICHPIPCGSSKVENAESPEDGCKTLPAGVSGGRLTFFKEGKLLLELSHRSDQGAWVQVKSKTYWPPSSTATTAAIQHPLRHDTPTTHSASDDCSSVNSSPWSSDHIRKQVGPSCTSNISPEEIFYVQKSPFIKAIRRKVRLRRNPYTRIKGPLSLSLIEINTFPQSSHFKDSKFSDKNKRLENSVEQLWDKCSLKFDKSVSVHSLFERVDTPNSDSVDPTFVSPRKRYLRSLESDVDSHTRKKVHSSCNSSFANYKHCDSPSASSPSFHTPQKSAINSQNSSSSYSIDSLLSNETETKKSESFLRTLLKPENKHKFPHPKSNFMRERIDGATNHVRYERGSSPYHKERRDVVSDHKKTLSDHFDMNAADLSRYTSSPNLGGFYLNPYFDPRYMMLQSLSAASPFLPAVTQSGDMAVAVAAAAAAGYPFNPLHMSALTSGSLLPPGALGTPYPPTSSIAAHLMRSPTPNRSSPLPFPHSPSPKPSIVPPPLPVPHHFGRMSSPRENLWSPSSASNSPHKHTAGSSVPSPPQDAPLNLSKPKGKS